MYKFFKMSKVLIFVYISFYITFVSVEFCVGQTNSGDQQQAGNFSNSNMGSFGDTPCNIESRNFRAVVMDLSQQCRGVGLSNCMAEATKCTNDNNNGSYNNGLGGIGNALQSAVMPMLTGGIGLPMVGGVPGGANADAFKCMPKTKQEGVQRELDRLRDDSQKARDKADEYQQKVEDQAETLQKDITDIKKKYSAAIEKSKKSLNNQKKEEREARENGNKKYLEMLDKVKEIEGDLAKFKVEKEDLENQIGDLYFNIVANPSTGCAAKAKQEIEGQKQKIIATQNEAKKSFSTLYSLIERQNARKTFAQASKIEQESFKAYLQQQYGDCMQAKTHEYQVQYKRLVAQADERLRQIKSLTETQQNLNKQLLEIPQQIAEDIEALKSNKKTENSATVTELGTMEQDINQRISLYQQKFQKANEDQSKKEMQLNIVQMQRTNFQSLFQMTTFGDAAALVEVRNQAFNARCEACEGVMKIAGCPGGDSSNTKDSTK